MTPVVIILIVLGIIFIFASFAMTENKEEEGEDVVTPRIPEELTDEQKAKIDDLIKKYMDENVDSKLDNVEAKFSEIVNQKTLALGDYAVTVNEEIEKNHNEVMFLYSMLNDKQKDIMTTATMVDDYRKDIEAYVQSNSAMINQEVYQSENVEEEVKEVEATPDEEEPTEDVKAVEGNKDIILEMHKSGLSILEIAKHLGLGVGEVKLVVDLYQGASK